MRWAWPGTAGPTSSRGSVLRGGRLFRVEADEPGQVRVEVRRVDRGGRLEQADVVADEPAPDLDRGLAGLALELLGHARRERRGRDLLIDVLNADAVLGKDHGEDGRGGLLGAE